MFETHHYGALLETGSWPSLSISSLFIFLLQKKSILNKRQTEVNNEMQKF